MAEVMRHSSRVHDFSTRLSRPRRDRMRVALDVSTSGSSASGRGIAGAMSADERGGEGHREHR